MDVWHRVVKDFDYNLDAPGEVSDEAMDALLAYLDIEIEESPNDFDWWATRIDAAAEADPARLLAALSIKDLRRVAASPDMIPALMLCMGAPGETLAELPWAERGWSKPSCPYRPEVGGSTDSAPCTRSARSCCPTCSASWPNRCHHGP